ncbi:YHYH domain-containing protein [Priestia megaterium]|nr:YHYH domain-containing protein [Priestia megaterium]
MKGIFKVAIFTFLFLLSCLFTQEVTYAHPGNTDEDGGHTCYTNCEDWGLEYGEYHYHDEPEEEEEPVEQEDDSDIVVTDFSEYITPIWIIITIVGGIIYWLIDWWQYRK